MIRNHSNRKREDPEAGRSLIDGISLGERDALLVIVILIATASYQTALSPPGGVWQDNYHPNETIVAPPPTDNSVSLRHHTSGTAILATNKTQAAYITYVFANSLGFYLSIFMIVRLTLGFPMVLLLHALLFLFSVNYATCVFAILPTNYDVVFYILAGLSVIYTGSTIYMVLSHRDKVKYGFQM